MRMTEDNDLLTLEIRVKREGVLDREEALGLIEWIKELLDEYDRGYADGRRSAAEDCE